MTGRKRPCPSRVPSQKGLGRLLTGELLRYLIIDKRLISPNFREYQNSLEAAPEETEPYDNQDGTMSDSAVGGVSGGPSNKSVGMASDAKRKKSIMTRLIPGRAGSALTLAGKSPP